MPTPTIGPQAGKLNLRIVRGSTFDQTLTYKDADGDPIDLTGATARAQVREEVDSSTILVTLTTENGGLTLGGGAGTIRLQISAVATALLDFSGGVWDLELVMSGVTIPLLAGAVSLVLDVTR